MGSEWEGVGREWGWSGELGERRWKRKREEDSTCSFICFSSSILSSVAVVDLSVDVICFLIVAEVAS